MNTGEFAKFCGTKKRTLFLYDQMGLLAPAAIHANGYREYQSNQVETMDMIKILQASGYTLRQIKQIICADAAYRRACFSNAKGAIDSRIEELVQMRDYITGKEQLLQEYLDFQAAGEPYKRMNVDITYCEEPISDERHFFGFIQDGACDGFLIDHTSQLSVFREAPQGVHKKGPAICFFLEIPSESPDLVDRIQAKLREFPFHGETKYFLRSLPHLLTEPAGTAIIKVVVFEAA